MEQNNTSFDWLNEVTINEMSQLLSQQARKRKRVPQGMQITKRARMFLPTPSRAMSAERHIFVYTNSVSVSTSGNSNDATQVVQGTTINNRIGNKLTLEKIRVAATWTNYDANNCCRFMLVRDKRSNGSIAQPADVLESASVYSAYNETNRERFEILFDKLVQVMTAGPTSICFVKTVACKRRVIYASSSTASPVEGAILAMQISDSSVASHPTCAFEVACYFQP